MPKDADERDYLTPNEVAKLLMVAPVTVRQWSQKGWLRAELTPGGHRRFLRTEVERFAGKRGVKMEPPESDEMRVLVVDDDVALAGYLEELLTTRGQPLECRVAHDGFTAGLMVQRFRPHVVLLDLRMPGMDGFQVCQQLKRDPETQGIRVIAMTGYFTENNVSRIMECGAERCLRKPFDSTELLAIIGVPGRSSASQ
ncbi:MAG: response regulator [Chromatiales bacterium]|nr:response regulator [Chromatiales bacterium]